jgi:phosphatidylglycerophosphate synthase
VSWNFFWFKSADYRVAIERPPESPFEREHPSQFTMRRIPTVLFIPNLLGYARIALAFMGLFYSTTDPVTAVLTWIVSGFLDLFDGILARALKQTSSFGVFLDIAADNVLRTAVWVAVAAVSLPNGPWYVGGVAYFLICLEWSTMVSTQVYAALNSEHWKHARDNDPWIVQAYFRNNFRNMLGGLGIYGLFSSNLWLYGSFHPVLYKTIPYFDALMYLAFLGRALSATIEIWFCCSYFSFLLENDDSNYRKQHAREASQKCR